MTIWPSTLCRTRRTWPEPEHSEQVTGCVPLRPGARAVRAGRGQPQRYRDALAEDRLLEGDVGHDLHVLTARRAGRASTARGATERAATAEERVEDVAQAGAEDILG